tara:strand:- start:109 stop:642 length:534 start_codon:yes stop_codon:yes gene_type:complete
MSEQPLRLRKKHGSIKSTEIASIDVPSLINGQSISFAIFASVLTIIMFSFFWVLLSKLTGRVFPWATIILGYLLGHVIRISGRGIDWRFPVAAVILTLIGSIFSNFFIAATVTAEQLKTETLEILLSVTSMTWFVFFDEFLNAADIFYAVLAMSIAAFFSKKRLKRAEYNALRFLKK